jgi:hypothetical protein
MKMILVFKFFLVIMVAGCAKPKTPEVNATPDVSVRRTVNVSTASQLTAALLAAKPGDDIVMADGIYAGKFVVAQERDGVANNRITLSGSRNAVLDAGSINSGYVLYLHADYWTIRGFTVTNGLKGIMADDIHQNIIDSIRLHHLGEEAIHLRRFSTHNIIDRVDISYTGLKTPDYGEGIYIGSANSNWSTYTNGLADKCDSNTVRNSRIGPFVSAECIDIKEGTTGGLITTNDFNSEGISGANSADSWMDVKGNNYVIEYNSGYNPSGSVLKDGYQVNVAWPGWGNNNEFRNNVSDVNAPGYGFLIRLTSSQGTAVGNKVFSNNQVTNAGSGISNIALSN